VGVLRAEVCGSAAVCGSVRQQCERQCAAVCGSVWQCAAVCGSAAVGQCAAVRQCGRTPSVYASAAVRAAVCGSACGSLCLFAVSIITLD
jgi:hypothetical protein